MCNDVECNLFLSRRWQMKENAWVGYLGRILNGIDGWVDLLDW